MELEESQVLNQRKVQSSYSVNPQKYPTQSNTPKGESKGIQSTVRPFSMTKTKQKKSPPLLAIGSSIYIECNGDLSDELDEETHDYNIPQVAKNILNDKSIIPKSANPTQNSAEMDRIQNLYLNHNKMSFIPYKRNNGINLALSLKNINTPITSCRQGQSNFVSQGANHYANTNNQVNIFGNKKNTDDTVSDLINSEQNNRIHIAKHKLYTERINNRQILNMFHNSKPEEFDRNKLNLIKKIQEIKEGINQYETQIRNYPKSYDARLLDYNKEKLKELFRIKKSISHNNVFAENIIKATQQLSSSQKIKKKLYDRTHANQNPFLSNNEVRAGSGVAFKKHLNVIDSSDKLRQAVSGISPRLKLDSIAQNIEASNPQKRSIDTGLNTNKPVFTNNTTKNILNNYNNKIGSQLIDSNLRVSTEKSTSEAVINNLNKMIDDKAKLYTKFYNANFFEQKQSCYIPVSSPNTKLQKTEMINPRKSKKYLNSIKNLLQKSANIKLAPSSSRNLNLDSSVTSNEARKYRRNIVLTENSRKETDNQ